MALCVFDKIPPDMRDEALVELAKDGNWDAFTILVHRYSSYIGAIVRSFDVKVGEHDDLLQEGFIGLYKAVLTYDSSKGKFKSYVSVCSSRSMISALRRNKPLPPIREDGGELLEQVPGDLLLEPEKALEAKERADVLLQLISGKLSDFELQTFFLYLEGNSYVEIAAMLQRPVKSVDNAIARAKKKLIYCLQ